MSNEVHEQERAASIPFDTVLRLLSDSRRRYLLASLRDRGSLPLPELAEDVARRESDDSQEPVSSTDVRCIYSELWHAHIPKLAELGVVELDADREVVELGDAARAIDRVVSLDEVEDVDALDE